MNTTPQNLTAITELLKNNALFMNVDENVIKSALLDKGCTEKHYPAQTVISDSLQTQKSLAFVLRGVLTVKKQKVLMKTIRRGDIYGVASLFSAQSESVSDITAETNTRILFFSEDLVRRLIDENSVLRMNYIVFLTERIRYLNDRIEGFTAENATEKLTKYLLSLDITDSRVVLPHSLSKLANMLNMGRASLYRAFDELEKSGIVKRKDRVVEITDISLLNRQ